MHTSNIGLMAVGLCALMTTNLACDFELPEIRGNNNTPEECEVRLDGLRDGDVVVAGTTMSVEVSVNLDCEFLDATEPVVDFNLWNFGSRISEPQVWGPFAMEAVAGEEFVWTATVDLEIPAGLEPGEEYSFGPTVTLAEQNTGIGHSVNVTIVQAN